MKDITVVGGGHSVLDIDLNALAGTVIAVNDAAVHLPRWDICVSMDRLWTEHRLTKVLMRSMEESPHREIWLRRSAVQNLPEVPVRWPWVNVFESDHLSNEFAPLLTPPRLNGMNSGICALNLAHMMARSHADPPTRVYLLGFDMNLSPSKQAYWYPPYPWAKATGSGLTKYDYWKKNFECVARQFREIGVDVLNVSPGSAITCFPKITPEAYAAAAVQR